MGWFDWLLGTEEERIEAKKAWDRTHNIPQSNQIQRATFLVDEDKLREEKRRQEQEARRKLVELRTQQPATDDKNTKYYYGFVGEGGYGGRRRKLRKSRRARKSKKSRKQRRTRRRR